MLGQLEDITKKEVRWARWFKTHPFSKRAAVLKGLVHIHPQWSLLSCGLA